MHYFLCLTKKHQLHSSLFLTFCCSMVISTHSHAQSNTPDRTTHAAVSHNYQIADTELNRVYQEVRTRYKDNPDFLQKLKKSQRLWIQFRNAEVAMRYPAKDKFNVYGSIYPICAKTLLTELTKARIKTLRQWLDGTVEGDVCSGSIRF